jgi:hypothetical protein
VFQGHALMPLSAKKNVEFAVTALARRVPRQGYEICQRYSICRSYRLRA